MKKSKFNVCAIDMNIEISYAIRRQELKKTPILRRLFANWCRQQELNP